MVESVQRGKSKRLKKQQDFEEVLYDFSRSFPVSGSPHSIRDLFRRL